MKIKVYTEDLKKGMYVAELDRPWVESPFLFQGFIIHEDDDLKQLKEACQYVYIDTEKTPVDITPQLQQLSAKQKPVKAKKPRSKINDFTDTTTLKKTKFNKTTFTEELVNARKARDKSRKYIDEVLQHAKLGESIDTDKAKELVAELAKNIVQNVDASMWLTQLKSRDEYTAIHSINVCILSLTFGRSLGLSEKDLNQLGLGALLHDIGKMRVPLDVLNKPGKLSAEEFEIMKTHPQQGYELLKEKDNLDDDVLTIIKNHHERLNGKGYPDKLKENEISLYTRIVSITDVYDAVTSDRVYHDGMTPHEALKKLYEWMPGNFDPELIESFIKTIGIYPVGSVVELKTGHIGVVVRLNEDNKLKPVIMMILNRNKEYYPKRKLVNLASSVWNQRESKPEIKRIAEPKEFNIDVKAIIDEESLNEIPSP